MEIFKTGFLSSETPAPGRYYYVLDSCEIKQYEKRSADGLEPQTPERSGADPPAPALTRASSVRKTSTVKITPQCSGGKRDVFVHAEVEGRIVNLMPDEEWPADTLKV